MAPINAVMSYNRQGYVLFLLDYVCELTFVWNIWDFSEKEVYEFVAVLQNFDLIKVYYSHII